MIATWIQEALKVAGVQAERLSIDEASRLPHDIARKFSMPLDRPHHLWESFSNGVALWCRDGWSTICDFGEPKPILLSEDSGHFIAYLFPSSEAMRAMLTEAPIFEFYVTNADTDFVLCHNHHDYIIGVGSSTSWVQTLVDAAV